MGGRKENIMKPFIRQENFKGQDTVVFVCPNCGREWYSKGKAKQFVISTTTVIRAVPHCCCDYIEPEIKNDKT